MYFETKIVCKKPDADEIIKTTKELYLVQADTFTEAEAKIIQEIKPYVADFGNFSVAAVSKSKIAEIFRNGAGKFFKVKANFITIDEIKGVEKKTSTYTLVEADNFKQALQIFEESMKGTISDYEIESIAETKILDIFE